MSDEQVRETPEMKAFIGDLKAVLAKHGGCLIGLSAQSEGAIIVGLKGPDIDFVCQAIDRDGITER